MHGAMCCTQNVVNLVMQPGNEGEDEFNSLLHV